MDYRRLGRSGLEVSLVGVGCNQFGGRCDRKQTRAVVHAALDVGITLFDTSNSYGQNGRSEKFLGAALKGCRDDAVVATKFASPMGDGPMQVGGSRRHVMQAVEDSLRRLRTDYIDLYQMHRPDPNTPIEETLSALDLLVRQGKVRYIGHSNFAGWQIAAAAAAAERANVTPFLSAQNHYSLLDRGVEAEVIPACEAFGLSLLPYFPLASGLLSGKYRPGEAAPADTRLAEGSQADRWRTPANVAKTERLRAVADASGHSLLELAMSWLARQPVIASVIAGASRPEHVRQNVETVGWAMRPDELEAIEAAVSDSPEA